MFFFTQDSSFLPLTPPTTLQSPQQPAPAPSEGDRSTPTTLDETNTSRLYHRALARSISPTNLPHHHAHFSSTSALAYGRSVSPITSPLLDTSGHDPETPENSAHFFGGHHSSSYPNISLANHYRNGSRELRDPSDASDDEFDDEVVFSREEREERDQLKQAVEKLTTALVAQQTENQRLRSQVEELSTSYTELKEQSLKAMAHLNINERLLREMTDKYSRTVMVCFTIAKYLLTSDHGISPDREIDLRSPVTLHYLSAIQKNGPKTHRCFLY